MTLSDSCARRLAIFSEGARRAANAGDREIDWDATPAAPAWMPVRSYATAISQLYYGELATIAMAERLTVDIDDDAAKAFIQTQIADERRHAAYYQRYLSRLGEIGEIEKGIAMAYDGALAWRGSYHGTVIAFHVVLEGEGLCIQQLYGRWFACPLFQQVNTLIARDEGRHVGFGKLLLKETLGALTFEERIAIYRWVRALWLECTSAIQAEVPRAVALLLGRDWAAVRWRRQYRTLRAVGLIADCEEALFERD